MTQAVWFVVSHSWRKRRVMNGAPGLRTLRGLVLFGQERAEAVELAFPGGAMIANPLLERAKAGSFNAASSNAAELFSLYEPGLREDLQVLGDGCERDTEGFSQTRNRHGAAGKTVKDGTAGGIPECVEQAIDLLWRGGHRGFDSW